MSDIAIKVENLSKRYRIGKRSEKHINFKESFKHALLSPFDYLRGTLGSPTEDELIWALKDVSFEVNYGEVVGIIGPNGAGKSTLLKVLCRITEPTSGSAYINGRIASLLEVGTGFHPELTGRENTYMNGAILGMSKKEIEGKFDEIVAFSEIEKFIDTPVKRYSSGMTVRLAFAVAAYLEPEILLVDEVLAVGDASFQKKCLNKMGDVTKEGRTILFVSHNMAAVQSLCSRCILLNEGKIKFAGNTRGAIEEHLNISGTHWQNLLERGAKILRKLEFINMSGEVTDTILAGEGGRIKIHYQTDEPIKDVHFSLSINTVLGIKVASCTTFLALRQPTPKLYGKGSVDCCIDSIPLVPGKYCINVAIDTFDGRPQTIDHIFGAFTLFVLESAYLGTTMMTSQDAGFALMKHRWILESSNDCN